MKKYKRLLAAFLAILFAMGALTISSFAEGSPAGNEFMQVKVETQQNVDYGDIITVTLNITNNYYATNMRWPVFFDSALFEFIDADFNGDFYNVTPLGQLAATGSSLLAVDATDDLSAGSSNQNVLLIQWVGNVNSGVVNCYNEPQGSDCISFRLKVKEDTFATSGIIEIPSSRTDLFYYQAMNDPSDSDTVYTMDESSCTMTFTDALVQINTEIPDVGAVAGTTTVIERFDEATAAYIGHNGYIYGMVEYIVMGYTIFSSQQLLNYIEPIGGATLQITANNMGTFSTGAKVEVVFDSSVVATYYIVVFGDIDGDGAITASDVSYVDNARFFLPSFVSDNNVLANAQYYACDMTSDYACDVADSSASKSVIYGEYFISQTRNSQLLHPYIT